ncbi:MAG TPA: HDOD domain-containing protein [Solirubrobacteraceae bacterium]|nr:HDOD domain-containing protein [Solirubrobacteraceae bacterium]
MSAAAQPAPRPDEPPDGAGWRAFLSRQPVLDGGRRVTGYRISYASAEVEAAGAAPGAGALAGAAAAPGAGALTGARAATRLFGDILTVVGLEELVGDALAHLPVTPGLLLTLGAPPVRPDQVVLRVAHEYAVDPELRPILDSLAGRGYALSLYDLPGPQFAPELLSTFGMIELDFAAWGEAELGVALGAVAAARATALAVGLRDEAEFARAGELGFSLFAGPFFSSPRTTAVRDVPVAGLSTLASVARMQGAGATVEELEAVIDRDLGLSVKLLRYINSAYFGMRSKVTSIRQAVMMLGARGVTRWAMMVALTGGTEAPVELSVMALTRGRMCELLAAGRSDVAPDEMFMIGLLSLADALLDTPLDRVLQELPLAEHVEAALLERAGPAGEILDAAMSYEIGSFSADSVQAHSGNVAAAYLDALRWARDTVQDL